MVIASTTGAKASSPTRPSRPKPHAGPVRLISGRLAVADSIARRARQASECRERRIALLPGSRRSGVVRAVAAEIIAAAIARVPPQIHTVQNRAGEIRLHMMELQHG